MSETCPGRFADGSGHRATSSQIGTARQPKRLDGLNRLTRSRTRWATRSIVMSPSPSRLEHPGKAGSPAPPDSPQHTPKETTMT
jgi:hypothetical protein